MSAYVVDLDLTIEVEAESDDEAEELLVSWLSNELENQQTPFGNGDMYASSQGLKEPPVPGCACGPYANKPQKGACKCECHVNNEGDQQ